MSQISVTNSVTIIVSKRENGKICFYSIFFFYMLFIFSCLELGLDSDFLIRHLKN